MLNPAEPPTAPADDAGRFSRLGTLTIAAVFGGLLLWSVLAPVSSAVIAPGRVTVETNRKAIQHLEGGVIADILVREGETVSAGEVLIRLDQTVPKANAALLTEQLAERIARQARLLAERDGLSEIPAGSRAFALAPEGLDYATQLDGQRRLLAAREETKKTIIALLEERIVQSRTRIDGAGTQIRSLKAQGKLIADELDGVKRLHAEGFAPLTRVRELEREKEAIAGRQGALVAQVAELESVISEARLEIERVRQKSREDATKEAEEVEVEIAGLIERRTAALDALARTEIRAPEDGVVLGLSVHTKGGVIAPGAAVMEIVPKASAGLLIAAEIAPRDVDKVQAGQAAVLRFSAFNARTTPEATGVVRQVSADSFVDKATGRPYFLVLIDLPASDELDRALKDQTLVPGMPVEAFIRTGARPAISYLLKPLTDALSRSMREE